jgi:ATP-dependent Zn protease
VQVALSSSACEDIFFKRNKNTDYRANELRNVSGFIRQNLMHGLLEDRTGLLFFDKFKNMSLTRQNFVDKVTEEVLETCYKEICQFIKGKKNMIEAVAEELVHKETLNREEITEIVNRFSE